ncbi:hypothetical protein CEK25_003650 [Fusarium fujikuroi]|nr:hypothetical protein CEK25_003650 [Fusarium fujikuroi]
MRESPQSERRCEEEEAGDLGECREVRENCTESEGRRRMVMRKLQISRKSSASRRGKRSRMVGSKSKQIKPYRKSRLQARARKPQRSDEAHRTRDSKLDEHAMIYSLYRPVPQDPACYAYWPAKAQGIPYVPSHISCIVPTMFRGI